jgi:pimeloyl-ACP methyl ester carboxylesterase
MVPPINFAASRIIFPLERSCDARIFPLGRPCWTRNLCGAPGALEEALPHAQVTKLEDVGHCAAEAEPGALVAALHALVRAA